MTLPGVGSKIVATDSGEGSSLVLATEFVAVCSVLPKTHPSLLSGQFTFIQQRMLLRQSLFCSS